MPKFGGNPQICFAAAEWLIAFDPDKSLNPRGECPQNTVDDHDVNPPKTASNWISLRDILRFYINKWQNLGVDKSSRNGLGMFKYGWKPSQPIGDHRLWPCHLQVVRNFASHSFVIIYIYIYTCYIYIYIYIVLYCFLQSSSRSLHQGKAGGQLRGWCYPCLSHCHGPWRLWMWTGGQKGPLGPLILTVRCEFWGYCLTICLSIHPSIHLSVYVCM